MPSDMNLHTPSLGVEVGKSVQGTKTPRPPQVQRKSPEEVDMAHSSKRDRRRSCKETLDCGSLWQISEVEATENSCGLCGCKRFSS